MVAFKRLGLSLSTVVLIMLAGSIMWPLSATAGPPPDAVFVGSEMCASCHDEVAESFGTTAHGLLLGNVEKYRDRLCESCHGPGSAHVEDQDPELIYAAAGADASKQQSLCLDCHSGRDFSDWQFSSHHSEDVSCSSCHSVHTAAGQVLKQETPDLCYGCHSDVRASFYLPSHHPVEEGKMNCETCHSIHGSDNEFVMGHDKRELCFTCHAEKEGPFMYEHDPVNEECSVCHTPHGSIADNLLVQAEPTLCLNCHSMHFHATISGIEADEFESPQVPGRYLSSTEDGFKVGMLTKCTQCHTQVHGSDLPAQSISSGGGGFTR